MTNKLYKENVYLKETAAKIRTIALQEGSIIVTLDNTIFFPGGGGQSCDCGTIAGYSVINVYEDKNEIYHEIDCPFDALSIGQEVVLLLNWEHRFDNMQRHCGEHILTGIFYREFGGINRGFHMGDDYMTIDIALEEDSTVDALTWQMCQHAELLANQIIYENLPMIIRHFETYEQAVQQPMRKKLTIQEDITLVGIGKPEYDWGCVSCCGTHPSTTGQVGLLKIFKLENNKGMFRIYFEAGQRAFLRYQKELDVLQVVCNKFSAGVEDLIEKYDIMQEKNKVTRNQLYSLKKVILQKESEEIQEELSYVHPSPSKPPLRRYQTLSLDDLTSLAREISPAVKKVFFLLHEPSNTALLVSNGNVDCSKLVRENAPIYGGKGGGNATFARAIFSKAEYVDTFVDLIQKHLR